MSDDISIVSIANLGMVVGTIQSTKNDLDALYAAIQNLHSNLVAAITGTALTAFETAFLGWMQQLATVKEDMDETYPNLNNLYQAALAAQNSLATIPNSTPPVVS